MSKRADPIQLETPRSVRVVLTDSIRLWVANPFLFALPALLVVVPLELVVRGVLAGGFADPNGEIDLIWEGVAWLEYTVLATAFVTAMHARTVVALASGTRPGITEVPGFAVAGCR